MERYLQARLPQILELVIPWAQKSKQRVGSVDPVNHASPVLDELRLEMQEHLPDLYSLKIGKQLKFKDFSALFSELYQNNQTPEWWKDGVLTNHMIMFSGVALGALGFALGAVSGGALTLAAASGGGGSGLLTFARAYGKVADTVTLLQVALMILLHERLCWLGIREINSKEFLARAAVDVLKISSEVKSRIEEKLHTQGKVEWETVLTDVITHFRKKTVMFELESEA